MILQALKLDFLDQLEFSVEGNLEKYRKTGPFALGADQVLTTPFSVPDEVPALGLDDVEAAKKLYAWLRFPTDRDARDNRVWTWLTHAVFADYCRQRWPLTSTDAKAASSIRDHWFLTGQGQGAVGRHALARLWWGVHATRNALLTHGFTGLVDSEWAYTEVLLGVQNTNVQIRDRAFSGNPKILLAALETLRAFGERGGSIDKGAAWLGRELNLVARYRSLDVLDFSELLALTNSLLELEGAPPTRGTRAPRANSNRQSLG